MQTPDSGIAKPESVSDLNYFSSKSCSTFYVFADEKTILGVNRIQKNILFKENIVDKSIPIVTYNQNTSQVWTIAVDEINNFLFSGEFNNYNGKVLQFDLETGRVLREYASLGIGSACSTLIYQNLCFVGGFNSNKLAVLDSISRQVAHQTIEIAIGKPSSLTICEIFPDSKDYKILLVATGNGSYYMDERTDVFDVTDLINQ